MKNSNKMILKLEDSWDLIKELNNDETLQDELELDDLLVDISLKFINYRINNNLTQKELADRLELSQSMVSKFESGEYNPTVEQLFKISKKLGWTFSISIGEQVEEFSECEDEEFSWDMGIFDDSQLTEDEYGACA